MEGAEGNTGLDPSCVCLGEVVMLLSIVCEFASPTHSCKDTSLGGCEHTIHIQSYNGVRLTISCWRNFQISGKYSLTNVSHCGEVKGAWGMKKEVWQERQINWHGRQQNNRCQSYMYVACGNWSDTAQKVQTNSVHCRAVQQVQREVATSI